MRGMSSSGSTIEAYGSIGESVRSYEATCFSHQTGSVAKRRKPRHYGRARLVPWIVLFTAIAGVALWFAHPRGSAELPPPDRRGWGHPGSPGSARGEKFRTGEIVTIRSHGVTVRVNRRAAAVFKGFLDELGDGGYPIRQPDTGGYNHRFKRCATPSACEGQLSAHSWGTAIDVNWTSNPLGTHDGCHMTTDMPADITALAERWGLRWGGNFSCRSKDPMHFEVTGRPQDTPLIVERNTGG